MADQSHQLLLDALTRAAAEPGGLSLYAQKGESGLFPATTKAKPLAERAKTEGLLRVVEFDNKGRGGREVCVLTEKGMQFLLRQANPRQIVEDFVRVLEDRQTEVEQLGDSVSRMADGLQSIREALKQVLPRLTEGNAEKPLPPETNDNLIADIKCRLAEWHASAEVSQDCPLPVLFARLESGGRVSIGRFHDALRQLHDDHQIYLHPWTGALYAMPEPAYALLAGHEIAYYASVR
ncbi:hypothetical protein [Zavarzinella formosa]|uniref:hypothetical protein n=1 Tax=Zavarzinella formosa TaxID=360055 RepID=UPI0002E090C5|nr:hypothetical protein [Zavarzinella formosa]